MERALHKLVMGCGVCQGNKSIGVFHKDTPVYVPGKVIFDDRKGVNRESYLSDNSVSWYSGQGTEKEYE
jgi:hypothetical protein